MKPLYWILAGAVCGDRLYWRLLWRRYIRPFLAEMFRIAVALLVLAGLWLFLAVAQGIKDGP